MKIRLTFLLLHQLIFIARRHLSRTGILQKAEILKQGIWPSCNTEHQNFRTLVFLGKQVLRQEEVASWLPQWLNGIVMLCPLTELAGFAKQQDLLMRVQVLLSLQVSCSLPLPLTLYPLLPLFPLPPTGCPSCSAPPSSASQYGQYFHYFSLQQSIFSFQKHLWPVRRTTDRNIAWKWYWLWSTERSTTSQPTATCGRAWGRKMGTKGKWPWTCNWNKFNGA